MDRKKQNKSRKIFITFAAVMAVVAVSAGIGIYVDFVIKKIPSNIYVLVDDEAVIDLNVPATGKIKSTSSGPWVDFSKPVTFRGSNIGNYRLDVKLFGLFDIRTVNVNVVNKRTIYPCGFPIGMYFKTDGVLVVNTGEFKDFAGNTTSPGANILQKGDYIVAINNQSVSSKKELNSIINQSKGANVVLKVRRKGEYIDLNLKPQLTQDGDYKVGLWVKDDSQGLGTVTFVTDDRCFGALGHGISDSTVNELMDISAGTIYKTRILTIVKGENGTPGEFIGTIDYSSSNKLGNIQINSESGIFGKIYSDLIGSYRLEKMDVGYGYQVHKGKAYIRLYQEKNYKDYEIEITDVRSADSKNITYQVTSGELLALTNGIVQGMSGCPIIQDGRLVGAVTHVFVDDSRCGYGIFIEKMLETMLFVE